MMAPKEIDGFLETYYSQSSMIDCLFFKKKQRLRCAKIRSGCDEAHTFGHFLEAVFFPQKKRLLFLSITARKSFFQELVIQAFLSSLFVGESVTYENRESDSCSSSSFFASFVVHRVRMGEWVGG